MISLLPRWNLISSPMAQATSKDPPCLNGAVEGAREAFSHVGRSSLITCGCAETPLLRGRPLPSPMVDGLWLKQEQM